MKDPNDPNEGPATARTADPSGTELPQQTTPPLPTERFQIMGSVGQGGMGTVWRAYDTVLERVVALKVIDSPTHGVLNEAKLAASLQHPGIVPVYEVGTFDDGRDWIAMRLIEGQTLKELLADEQGERGLHRLIGHVIRVTEALIYAHQQGVVHRDIKPGNIHVGGFGEVIVLDWGIAGRIREQGIAGGTPGFAAPEQGKRPVEPCVDVFGLGRLLSRVLAVADPKKRETILLELIQRSTLKIPEKRLGATQFVDELTAWLEGAQQREAALKLVKSSDRQRKKAQEARERAADLQRRADEILGPLEVYASGTQKARGWTLEGSAAEAIDEARRLDLEAELRLRQALARADIDEVRSRLTAVYRQRVLDAEQAQNLMVARDYTARLTELDPQGQVEFLAGDGALTLVTDPPGAKVYIAPYKTQLRRLVVGAERLLGTTPLRKITVPRGRHCLRVVKPGHQEVTIPIYIARGEHWDGIRPGEHESHPIWLPRLGALTPEECYVPAGWFQSGGDPHAMEGLPHHRLWIDGFVIERYPLTYSRLIKMLNTLVEAGREAHAAIAPERIEASKQDNNGYLILKRDQDGFYRLQASENNVMEWPVNLISWHNAHALALVLTERTGRKWRLPHGQEREKATRGVDGRRLPWGNYFEPTWACTVHSREGAPMRAPVTDFKMDESPYGVRGLAGNIRDWCSNPFHRTGQATGSRLLIKPCSDKVDRVVRGGAWAARPELCLAAGRFAAPPSGKYSFVGVRLVWSIHDRV